MSLVCCVLLVLSRVLICLIFLINHVRYYSLRKTRCLRRALWPFWKSKQLDEMGWRGSKCSHWARCGRALPAAQLLNRAGQKEIAVEIWWILWGGMIQVAYEKFSWSRRQWSGVFFQGPWSIAWSLQHRQPHLQRQAAHKWLHQISSTDLHVSQSLGSPGDIIPASSLIISSSMHLPCTCTKHPPHAVQRICSALAIQNSENKGFSDASLIQVIGCGLSY